MSVVFCTIINEAFVPRALVLGDSIARRSPSARFAYYCMDDAAADLLEKCGVAPETIVRPAAFETDELRALKGVRRTNEYCWTCKPAILIHAARSNPRPDWLVWLDSDMMAFGDLAASIASHESASVLLTPHSFSLPKFAAYEPTVGRFNAGFVAFRANMEGFAALEWWMARCLEGCPAVAEPGRYADQKYLDQIPELFPNAVADVPLKLNAAPWNVFGRDVGVKDGQVLIDGVPLLLYHFQGLKIIRSWVYDLYGARPSLPRFVRQKIYGPYVRALTIRLQECAARVGRPLFGIDQGFSGLGGMLAALKRLRWSPNMIVKF